MTYLRHRLICLSLFVCLSAGAASAQTYPDYVSTTVNDFADLLPDADELALTEQLERLNDETGVEMTVVTMATQAPYAPDMTLEDFATGLFNHWGIGDAERNDGVMILVIPDDRRTRLELGAAYGNNWDRTAYRIVQLDLVAAFAEGAYADGIRAGTTATIEQIVLPFSEGQESPAEESEVGNWLIMGGFALFFVLVAGRRWVGGLMVRLRRCPSCGRRGLRESRSTLFSATTKLDGHGERVRRCSYCNHEERDTYVIPRRGAFGSSGGSFGGGRSGGGGASGRW
ncbi:MAG: TPM domain-containing protein [Pseudomonadota bacterium]